MTQVSEIVPVLPGDAGLWKGCLAIYHEAYPAWEREPVPVLRDRLNDGRYLMRAGLVGGKAIGFFIIHREPEHRYAMFSFVAVEEKSQGHGYGTALCRDAIALFHTMRECDWFVIEAEDRQADFYGRLGFLKVDVPYFVPRFGDGGVEPMHLMVISQTTAIPRRRDGERVIEQGELSSLVERVYIEGYLLTGHDPRLKSQLSQIRSDAALRPWPEPPSTADAQGS